MNLKRKCHEDYEYVKSLEKEVDELESEKADFSNIYDLLLEESHLSRFPRPNNSLQIVQLHPIALVALGCIKAHDGNLNCSVIFVGEISVLLRFGNDQFAPILVMISESRKCHDQKYGLITYEGLNHNLFSVGQFCDADLEVAFRKSTCFVRD
ncbi:hypothetical protein Tco_0427658 [Tanacetum coccineum]